MGTVRQRGTVGLAELAGRGEAEAGEAEAGEVEAGEARQAVGDRHHVPRAARALGIYTRRTIIS